MKKNFFTISLPEQLAEELKSKRRTYGIPVSAQIRKMLEENYIGIGRYSKDSDCKRKVI